jgi:hypothetical protein
MARSRSSCHTITTTHDGILLFDDTIHTTSEIIFDCITWRQSTRCTQNSSPCVKVHRLATMLHVHPKLASPCYIIIRLVISHMKSVCSRAWPVKESVKHGSISFCCCCGVGLIKLFSGSAGCLLEYDEIAAHHPFLSLNRPKSEYNTPETSVP